MPSGSAASMMDEFVFEFDNYENENLRAIALEVIIQSDSKTLSENEINELSTKIISQAKTQFNAKLR